MEGDLLEDRGRAAGVIPGIYVSAVAEARLGARPNGLFGTYGPDRDELARYASMARTPRGFGEYMGRQAPGGGQPETVGGGARGAAGTPVGATG